MMKKPAFLLFIALLLSLLFTAAAAETSGDFDYEVLEDGTVSITMYNRSDSQLEIPETLDGRIVTNLSDYILNFSDAMSISIPDTVTEIQGNPFRNGSSLNQILVTENHPTLATIDGVLFSKPDKRLICYPPARTDSNYEIPQGIQIIGEVAFGNASNLKSLSIPDSVTHIDNLAFEFCNGLASITLPDGIIDMGDNPFFGCKNLASIRVTDKNLSLATIDGVLFHKKDKRLIWYPTSRSDTSYAIPDGIQVIDAGAFALARNLKDIFIPGSVTSIGNSAFQNCVSLTSIAIPNGVDSIGIGTFFGCTSLSSITIPDGVTFIGRSAFYGCKSLSTITIPDGVTSIENGVFQTCTRLTSITIPDSVTSIGNYAFNFCSSLTSITIPDSVTSISDTAFSGCKNLTITASEGSYAHQFAQEHGIPFTAAAGGYRETTSTDWLNQ